MTGKIFIWLDKAGSVTTGTHPTTYAPPPSLVLFSSIGTTSNGTNQTLANVVDMTRDLTISTQVETSRGTKISIWQQTLVYCNWNDLYDFGMTQVVVQQTSGSATSSEGYSRSFNYPLLVNSTTIQDKAAGSLFISAAVERGLEIEVIGQSVFPTSLEILGDSVPPVFWTPQSRETVIGTRLTTTQNGSATYFRHGNFSSSPATTQQDLVFSRIQLDDPKAESTKHPELYRRHVLAVNDTLVEDQETDRRNMSA